MKKIVSAVVLVLFGLNLACWAEEVDAGKPRVRLETSKGNIVLELNPEKAPLSVENFLSYVRSGFYDGTIFHRVIKGFMVQTGGFTEEMERKETQDPIKNEADSGLKNRRGTVAMARTNVPHSATSQFFINTVDNGFLNHKNKSVRGWGYAVFGKVVKGMEVVFEIEGVGTTSRMGMNNVPTLPIVLNKAVILE